MKPLVIVCAKLPANGMAIFPFIIVKNKISIKDAALINHEKIHLKQQLELLILPFYIAYLFLYIINLIVYKNHHKAYLNIVFEKEAYANDENLNYLQNRKFFAWFNLL